MIPEPLTQQPSLETRSQALFEERYPWSRLQNSAVAIIPSTLLAVLCPGPASPLGCVIPTHREVTSSPAAPPDGNRSPTTHHSPAASTQTGIPLCRWPWVLPVPSLPPNTLKPLNHSLNCFLPQGPFRPHHSLPEATTDPDLFRRDLFPTWERWDKIVPAVTPLSTLTCSWVLF